MLQCQLQGIQPEAIASSINVSTASSSKLLRVDTRKRNAKGTRRSLKRKE